MHKPMKRSAILVLLVVGTLSCQFTNLLANFSPTPTRPRPTATPPVARVVTAPEPTVPPPTQPPPPVTATIRGDSLRVRAAPNTNAAIVDRLNRGDTVQVVGRNATNDWLQIILPRDPNARGWISTAYAELGVPIETLPLVSAVPAPYP